MAHYTHTLYMQCVTYTVRVGTIKGFTMRLCVYCVSRRFGQTFIKKSYMYMYMYLITESLWFVVVATRVGEVFRFCCLLELKG